MRNAFRATVGERAVIVACAGVLLATGVASTGTLLSGCGSQPKPVGETKSEQEREEAGHEGKTVKISYENKRETVLLSVGDQLEVTLPSNPQGPYRWETDLANQSVLKETDSEADEEEAASEDGTSTWRFKAVAAGKMTLKMINRRLGGVEESTAPPTDIFEVKIEVEE